jgi:hypothetical protein
VVSDDVAPRPDGGDGVATVEKLTLDELVARDVIDPARVGLVWIDAQGHEGHVLAGADELLDRGVPVVARFQPRLLAEAGGLELFTRQITRHFTSFVALGAVSGRHQDAQPRGVRDLINIAENFDTDERSARLGAILAFRAPKAVRPHPAAVRPHPVAAPQASSGLKKLSEPAAARKPGARKKRSSVGTAPTPGGREKRPSPVAKPS